MKVSVEASRKIESMSLLCAILVVVIHTPWADQVGPVGWFFKTIVKRGVSGIAVPFFFLVSGYFLSAHFGESGWWVRETKKRIGSLVMPFFLWTVLAILLDCLLGLLTDWTAHRPFGTGIAMSLGHPLRAFGFDLMYFPKLGPLWFVRCLFVFVLASPLIRWCVERYSYVWLVFVLMASMAVSAVQKRYYGGVSAGNPISYFTVGLSVSGLFYFSAGMLIRFKQWRKTDLRAAIACLLVGGIKSLSVTGIVARIPFPFVPPLLYGVWHFVPSRQLPAFLRGCAFPIFLMHMIVFDYVRFALENLPVALTGTARSLVFLACGVIVPIVFCNLLRRISPGTSKWLFCGRS